MSMSISQTSNSHGSTIQINGDEVRVHKGEFFINGKKVKIIDGEHTVKGKSKTNKYMLVFFIAFVLGMSLSAVLGISIV